MTQVISHNRVSGQFWLKYEPESQRNINTKLAWISACEEQGKYALNIQLAVYMQNV